MSGLEVGVRVLAISDNAQYHRSKPHLEWRGQQASQFGLDFLPPYSPDLNPIERVWKLTRSGVFTIATLHCWMASLPPSKIGFLSGSKRTIPCTDYAQLPKTLCLDSISE
ncbi:MAG TPA: transposase [Bryobacteraceae bacterium]|nr:transposase [Bryobacteraceae bacterium]